MEIVISSVLESSKMLFSSTILASEVGFDWSEEVSE